jgi:eukaryotic-like serine/threonine-protein kinase
MSAIEQFGKYLLLEKIAAGGMAEVYLSKSIGANGLNKFFAIKRILPQFSSNEEFVSMFKDEANVAINLNHSNIVSIFDFGVEKSQFYLVMDYVEGRNLRQIINELKKSNRSFSIDQALFMVKEAAAGLDHAHRCTDSKSGRPLNITHRDMSPQNVMVSFEGEVKVIDFGIAKAETENEETKAGTLKGKFGYMSPEQAEGLPIDPRTDVFALGIVLWELLANDRLFTGSNEATILRKVRDCQVPSIRKVNPTVPPELERIVMKALAKDRNVRYQTAANFHRDLNRFLNTQFPDFSPQDFSHFIRDSFKTAYQEGRDKLIQYSKVAAPVALENTVTAVPQKKLAIETNQNQQQIPRETPAPHPLAAPEPVENPEMPPGLSTEQQVKINLDGVLNANMGAPTKLRRSQISGTPQSALGGVAKKPTPNFNKSSITNIQQTRVTQRSQMKSGGDMTSVLFKLIIVGALAYGGYWGYFNYYLPQTAPQTVATTVPKSTPQPKVDSGTIEMAATASIKVSVNSTPQGATIYLDGKDTGYYTPAIISVTANKDAVFILRKDGYLEYEVSNKYAQTGQLLATLQPTARAGYLNIYLSNGGEATKISVNGKELAEASPIKKYPILADTDTIVKAFNPITQLTDEQIVRIKPGQSKDIELILGRSKVKPKEQIKK